MKVLFISDMIAEKTTGGAILSLQHLETIKAIFGNENVESLVICENSDRFLYDKNELNVHFSYENKIGMLKNCILLNYPLMNSKIEKEIMKIIYSKNIELVFLDNSMYGNTIKKIKKKFGQIKVISFFHDIKKDLFKQHLKSYGIKFLPKYLTGIYNEKLTVRYSDKTIVLSKREQALFEKLYKSSPNEIIPIYSKDKYKYEQNLQPNCNTKVRALFVGGYYYPNVNGIKWFIKNVLDSVDVTLDIVGYNMEKLKDEIQNSKVNIIGSVDDVSEYYENCSFIIAPIFEGGGMKTKVAEALMYGKPILGTSEAFEGYDFEKNEFTCVCNENEEFINAINSIDYKSIHLSKNQIRQIYLENYSEGAIRKKLKQCLLNN